VIFRIMQFSEVSKVPKAPSAPFCHFWHLLTLGCSRNMITRLIEEV
jgi:hypothetical protein